MKGITTFLWFDGQAGKAAQVMEAVLKMKKLDIAALRKAAA